MSSKGSRRGLAVLAIAALVAGAFAMAPATAAKKGLTKKRAMKLFYTKGGADARFINVGEMATSYEQATTLMANFTNGDVLTHTVTVPAAGHLLIWANVSWERDNTDPNENPIHAEVRVDGVKVGTTQESQNEIGGNFPSESIANAVRAPVAPGARVVTLNVLSTEADEIVIEGRSIMTLFVPT